VDAVVVAPLRQLDVKLAQYCLLAVLEAEFVGK
jgi:hypothetical protein